jgi:hypothetical protein
MSLVEHAKEELRRAGMFSEDGDFYGGMTGKAVMDLIQLFSDQGHSGGSAPGTIQLFSKLANYGVLTPITGDDDEWIEYADGSFQNKRESGIFKDGKGGIPYFIHAIVWRGQFPDQVGTDKWWDTFNGRVEGIGSSQNIKEFPFTPKTFYVDVVREQLPDDWNEEPYIEGSKWYNTDEFEKTGVKVWHEDKYRYRIKDPKQLDEVFSYYNKREISNKQ